MSGIQLQLPSNILDALQIFANTAWHNPSAFRRTHQSSTSRDVEYLYLQDHTIALRYLFGGPHNQILVREEYREALRELQTDTYEQGVYIIGQPGIGKTSFLIYALIERLGKHKPVAVQLRTSDPFYAFFTHTCTLHSLSDPAPLVVQADVWALSDLRVSTTTPLDIFLDVSVKVVQATLPSAKYWKAWSRYRGAEMFVMNTWSEEEIADLSSLLELDVDRMVALATKWGGVPRMLLQQCKKSESQQDWELHAAAFYFVENYAAFLPALHSLDIQGSDAETSSAIFFILPLKDHAGDTHRSRYDIRVPTMAFENALAIALQEIENATKRNDIFLLMTAYPGSRSCIKNICVNWFYSLAASRDAFRYSSDCGDYYGYLRNAMSSIGEELPIIRSTAIPAKAPYFWIAPSGEFLGIDCALVTGEYIFAIQVPTTSKPTSSSPQIGLDKLRKLLPARNIWIFLTFGISRELVVNACTRWRDKLQDISQFGYWVANPADVAALHKK